MFPAFPVRADHHPLPVDVTAHDHDFFELAVATHGRGTHITAAGDHRVEPGSAVLIPPNQWHAYADCEDLEVFDCFVGPELFDGALSFVAADLRLFDALTDRSLPAPQSLTLPPAGLDRVVAELEQLADPATSSRSALLGHLLLCCDILNESWVPTAAEQRRSAGRLHPAVAATAAKLEAARDRPWTLGELAEDAAIDRSHLVRLFQRDLGISPIAYLNQLRSQEAARLLVQSDEPVARIGSQVGWDDAAHFARRFKATFGLSPSAYRQRALAGEAGH